MVPFDFEVLENLEKKKQKIENKSPGYYAENLQAEFSTSCVTSFVLGVRYKARNLG